VAAPTSTRCRRKLQVSVPQHVGDEIDRIAEREDTSVSAVSRRLLMAALDDCATRFERDSDWGGTS
jgi:hypothetical protein